LSYVGDDATFLLNPASSVNASGVVPQSGMEFSAVLRGVDSDGGKRADAPTRPACTIVPTTHASELLGWRYGVVRTDLTAHEFFHTLARLGGHQNRRHDHPPGWIVR